MSAAHLLEGYFQGFLEECLLLRGLQHTLQHSGFIIYADFY